MAARKFLVPIDLTKNEIQNAVAQNLASAPGSPGVGQFYFDTVNNAIYAWNGTAWAVLDGLKLRLDQIASPNTDVSLNSHKITNLLAPASGTDAANKAYVDTTAQGLSPKPTAQVATAAVLAACTYANGTLGVGATLTGNSNGALTVDSYAVLLNDAVLVKNQSSSFQNGLYTQTQLGDGSHSFILTRHADMDQATEFGGSFIAVENNGSTTANTLWLCNVANSITVGTTAVTLTQLNAATSLTQGNGISISGNAVSVVPDTGITVSGSGVKLDTTIAVRKFAVDVGDGSSASIVITHNLGTLDVTVALYSKTTPFGEAECDVQHTSTNTITLVFATAPTAAQYRCVVHG